MAGKTIYRRECPALGSCAAFAGFGEEEIEGKSMRPSPASRANATLQ
jgi:hypothetical protein